MFRAEQCSQVYVSRFMKEVNGLPGEGISSSVVGDQSNSEFMEWLEVISLEGVDSI